MQRVRIERKAPVRRDADRYAVLPLDPRDPDIVRAKLLGSGVARSLRSMSDRRSGRSA
jgi:hypothetical protein